MIRHEIKLILTSVFWSVNCRPISRKSWFLEIQLLGKLDSRHLAGFLILTLENDSENFRLICPRFYGTICEMPKKTGL